MSALTRNRAFLPDRQPLKDNPNLQVDDRRISGPFQSLNPTSAHLRAVRAAKPDESPELAASDHGLDAQQRQQQKDIQSGAGTPADDVTYKWTSRNNRKGRHALSVVQAEDPTNAKIQAPPATNTLREVGRGILRMCTSFPVWDVSYLVATIFTLGSVVWVINAFFVFLPLLAPSTEFDGESLYGGGISAFIGATIFEVGSVLLILEAVNENRTGCFGWALEEAFESTDAEKSGQYLRLRPSPSACTHHHPNKKNLVGRGNEESAASQSWTWWPSWYDLKTHYLHELGFLASFMQLLAASVFWISGFTALPGIYDHLSMGAEDGVYWVPQVIGGAGFVMSGFLFMIETQPRWYVPAPTVLGWHIGLWNFIGGWGFLLCPAFGFCTASWAQYQASCSTFWGSWAFLIGSTIQWYESLSKNPVEVTKTLPGMTIGDGKSIKPDNDVA